MKVEVEVTVKIPGNQWVATGSFEAIEDSEEDLTEVIADGLKHRIVDEVSRNVARRIVKCRQEEQYRKTKERQW